MMTGLAASTVTPGSTAPDVSLTTPVNELCAWATLGRTRSRPNATKNAPRRRAACLAISTILSADMLPTESLPKNGFEKWLRPECGRDDTTVAHDSASVLKDLKRRSQKQRGRRVARRPLPICRGGNAGLRVVR